MSNDFVQEKNDQDEDLLQGIWAENKKQIQYFEYDDWLDYLFANDILTVFEEGDILISYQVIKLSKDSLILQAEEYVINLYKR